MWEVAEFGKCAGKSPGGTDPVSRPYFPRGGGTTNPIILLYNCYICILLIKTNPMIYICCTKHKGKGVVCVLTVGDNELNIGEWGRVIELAEGRDTRGKALRTGPLNSEGWGPQGIAGDCVAPGTPVDPQVNIGYVSLQFYNFLRDHQVLCYRDQTQVLKRKSCV